MPHNYRDSGVYLIKAAETFLNRPDEFLQRLMVSAFILLVCKAEAE